MRIAPVCQGGIRRSLHKYISSFALHPLIRDNTPLSLYKSDFILQPFTVQIDGICTSGYAAVTAV